MPGFEFLAGGCENDRLSLTLNALEKLPHFRERPYQREIFFADEPGAIFVELFPETPDLLSSQEFRKVLVGAFADLRAQ